MKPLRPPPGIYRARLRLPEALIVPELNGNLDEALSN